jgi:hypothetical protein
VLPDVLERAARARGAIGGGRMISALVDTGGAVFSACGLYRYELRRNIVLTSYGLPMVNATVDESRKLVFGMLNPSVATADKDDPTIRRCIGFAAAWGFRHLSVFNAYAFISPYPEDLWKVPDPVGPDNDAHILDLVSDADMVIAAWGVNIGRDRERAVRELLGGAGVKLHHLGLTKDGHPRHPLYLPKTVTPTEWA